MTSQIDAARLLTDVKRIRTFPKRLDRVHRVARDATVDRIVHIGRRFPRVHTKSNRRVGRSHAVLRDFATETPGSGPQRVREIYLQDRCHTARNASMFHIL